MMVLPVVASVVLVVRRARSGSQHVADARWWCLIAMCVALNLFILRPPMAARIGGMAGPVAVLGAWLAAQAWRANVAGKAAAVAGFAVVVWSISVTANWEERFHSDAPFRERMTSNLRAMSESPPDPKKLSAAPLAALVSYLRECTAPDDAVFATWFAPEVAFFAQRPFGARMAETWQWADTRFQQQSGKALALRPTVVIINVAAHGGFAATYPILDWYLREEYRPAGQPAFADGAAPAGYQVLVRSDRVATRIHAPSTLPCFA
jgi:hypothetical protein